MKKIVVIGPESTGKSSLSANLATTLNTVWVEEYARQYLNTLTKAYTETDLLAIARGQIAAEDSAMHDAHKYLICDTDLYVIKVWAEAKYNRVHPEILHTIASRKYDLYLLTYIDIPWEDDPLREHSAAEERHYFYNQYRDIVIASGVPWADVRGTRQQRLQTGLNAIQDLK